MGLVLLVEKPDGLWENVFESASPCLDAPLTSTRRQQREQSGLGGCSPQRFSVLS